MKKNSGRIFSSYISLFLILMSVFVLAEPLNAAGAVSENKAGGSVQGILSFSGGLAGVCSGGQWGFINTAGLVAIKFIFKEVSSFNADLAPARVDKQKWGYINKKGLFVINPRFDAARPFSSGLAPVKKGNLWGFIDTKGRLVHDYAYEDLKGFYYGLAPAKRVGKWGFIDKNGRFAIKRQWLEAGEFREGLAPVKDLENQWGYIDTKGNIYIETQFDDAMEFSERLAPVKVESKWGFVSYKGKYRINPQFDQARQFSEGLAAVKENGKWGYVDPRGHDAIPNIYDEAADFSDGLALVSKDGLAYYIDDEGEKALDVTMKTGSAPVASAPATAPVAGNSLKASTLDFEIYYVSAANSMESVKHKNDAVYLIKIKGAGLNQEQLFKSGLNGFRYEIDVAEKPNSPDPDRYRVYAYPLNGVKYSDDGLKNAALNPGDIAFYWIGPKPYGKHHVTVMQLARDFNSNKDVIFAEPAAKALPSIIPAPADLDYTISFRAPSGETYFNGVCAYPVDIRITKNGIEAPDEIYDRLVFYSKEQTGALNKDKTVGADPSDNNKLALMPSEWGNKMKSAQPHYGIPNEYEQGSSMKYRTYYVYAMPYNKPDRSISVQLLDDSGTIVKDNDFTLNPRLPIEVNNVCDLREAEMNSEKLRTLYLEGEPFLSDPSKGDFDFVFERASSPDNYFIVPLLPEGMNERNLFARFNFSTFRSGFYMRPPDMGGKIKRFKVSDRTSSLYYTCGRDIYAFIFDIYGRYARSPLFTDNRKKLVKRLSGGGSEEMLNIEWCSIYESQPCAKVKEAGARDGNADGKRFLIGLDNETQVPVIFKTWGKTEDGPDYKRREYAATEIIAAPRSSEGRDKRVFYATGDDQIFWKGSKVCWEMKGYSLVSKDELFHNKYEAKKIGPALNRLQIRSERTYKEKSSLKPYGTEGEFVFFATSKGHDRYARSWEVRCNDWDNVHSGYWRHDGDWEYGHVEGGDFYGSVVKDKNKKWFVLNDPW